jgi:hypothetical protein
MQAISKSLASLVDGCEKLFRSVEEGLVSTVVGQRDCVMGAFGLRKAIVITEVWQRRRTQGKL